MVNCADWTEMDAPILTMCLRPSIWHDAYNADAIRPVYQHQRQNNNSDH